MVEIVVPDSYESLLRLLVFMYSGTVMGSSSSCSWSLASEAALEDLVAADRYRLLELKSLCESMVEVHEGNCLEVLALADLYSAPRLRESALAFAVRHLDRVASSQAYRDFAAQHPTLVHDIFDKIKATSPHTQGLTADEAEQKRKEEVKALNGGGANEDEEEEKLDTKPFPWTSIGGLLVCGLIYHQFSNIVALGWLVPAFNILFTVAIVAYGIMGLKD